ncbi:MAG: hypothetical protein OCD76_12705 [Reichenbachiella sp.]
MIIDPFFITSQTENAQQGLEIDLIFQEVYSWVYNLNIGNISTN